MIGSTPLVKINYMFNSRPNSIYAKLEYYNLTGSIKDRMARHIIEEAKKSHELKPYQPIVEATSGNTGIALSAIGSYYNHPVHIFMPDWVSKERKQLMQMYGANIHLVSREDGGFKKAIELADKLAEEIDGYRPNQFTSHKNIEAHYLTTGKEIINSIKNIGGFVSGIGTGGTIMGVGSRLKESDPTIKIYVLEPDTLPIISKGIDKGAHKIEGIGDDFIPDIVDVNMLDEIILINDNDAINMARIISNKFGIGVGISSGANLLAAIIAKENNERNIVTVFPDDNKKYLSTDLVKPIDHNPDFISNQIELIDYN